MRESKFKFMKWKRKPQEKDGTYMFCGQFLATSGVAALLTQGDIQSIYNETQSLVDEHNGLDYLQVYVNEETNGKLFFIDQLNQEMIASGGHRKEDNYCTLLLAEEY